MKRKNWTKLLWILLPVGLAAGLLLTMKEQKEVYCSDIQVVTEDSEQGLFLTEDAIVAFLTQKSGQLKGKNINTIDVSKLEHHLAEIPYVADADVYFTMQGVLKVRIRQRKAIARLFDKSQHSVYLASDGRIMPVSGGFHNRLLVVSGEFRDTLKRLTGKNINDPGMRPVMREIYKTASFIDGDTFTRALIAQIYLNEKQELELIPSVDDHTILTGNSDSLDYKFKKLMAFYRKGMIRTGWDPYKQINLKYSNQVICTNK